MEIFFVLNNKKLKKKKKLCFTSQATLPTFIVFFKNLIKKVNIIGTINLSDEMLFNPKKKNHLLFNLITQTAQTKYRKRLFRFILMVTFLINFITGEYCNLRNLMQNPA